MAESEAGSNAVYGILGALIALVGSWLAWARGSSKQQHDAADKSAGVSRETIQNLFTQVTNLQSQMNQSQAMLVAQAKEIGVLQGKVQGLENHNTELVSINQSLKLELASCRAEVEKLQKANDELQGTNSSLRELLGVAQRKLVELEAKYRKLAP